MTEGGMLKKITEAMKDLVTEANFDCTGTGISLQAMDSSHVSLVGLLLRADGFDHFRCDRNISLGINLGSMGKVRHALCLQDCCRHRLPPNFAGHHPPSRCSSAATTTTS